jgi:tight adherence protein C
MSDFLTALDVPLVMAALLAAGGVLCLVWGVGAHLTYAPLNARLQTYVSLEPVTRTREPREPLRTRVVALLLRLGKRVDNLLPERQVTRIRANLAAAGFFGQRDLMVFLGAKALLAMALALAGPMLLLRTEAPALLEALLAMIGGAVGFYAPGIWLGQRISARKQALGRALPDALDLLAISVGAGLGFDSALIEVVQRWQNPLTEELGGVLRDMRLGKSRREALRALADRIQQTEIASFVAGIVQADELGTPIRDTLRIQADQIRNQRRQRAEEKARQATIKMLIPMALFIFPAIFIVLIGPALPQLTNLRR